MRVRFHRLLSGLFLLPLIACTDAANGGESEDGTIQGEIRGPAGSTLTLRLNGEESLEVGIPTSTSAKYAVGTFTFETGVAAGAAYQVEVQAPPTGQTCSVLENGSGEGGAKGVIIGCEYVHDLVSRDTSDKPSNGYRTGEVAIGGSGVDEGRYVAFQYYDDDEGFGGTKNGIRQIFWRDRLTGETVLVSKNAAGEEGDATSEELAISADGLSVVFTSGSTNLAPNDRNGATDVFVWRAAARDAGATLVSRAGADGPIGDGASSSATLSADGSVVAFQSYASNLTADKASLGRADIEQAVFRKELGNGSTKLISLLGTGAAASGSNPSISADGSRIAFHNYDNGKGLVADDDDSLWDIYVYDHASSVNKRVSLTQNGADREQGKESASRVTWPTLSGDGRYVAYSTTADNVIDGDTNGTQDIFLVEVDTGQVRRVSVATGGDQADGDSPAAQGGRVALSYDARWLAYSSTAKNLAKLPNGEHANILVHDTQSGETRAVAKATYDDSAVSITATGAYVAFLYGDSLDARFPQVGATAHFTGAGPAFFWKQ